MSYRSFKRVLGETSLERKCRFLFGACLLVLIAASFYLYSRLTESIVYKQNPASGRLLVDTALIQEHWENWNPTDARADAPGDSFERSVGKDEFQELIQELSKTWQMNKFEKSFIRPDKVEKGAQPVDDFEREFLRTAAQASPIVPKSAAVAANDEEKPVVFTERFVEAGKQYEYYQAIYAARSCVGCHRVRDVTRELNDGDLMAVAKVRISNGPTQANLNLNRAFLLSSAIVTVFLAMVASWVIVRYVIVKPLKHLRDVSDEISKGDITQRAEIHTGDEFEALATAFNRMLRHLTDTQQEIRKTNSQLDAKVDELAQLNMRLFELNRLKSDFLATMSHELRTPLNSIIGFSEVLGSIASLDDKQKRYVVNIQKSGKVLLDMINDILDLAKIESGKMELRLTDFPIEHVVHAQCDSVRPLSEKKNIDLTVDLEPADEPMYQDQNKLQQILNNLLSNAIKFTPEGGRIDVRTKRTADDRLEMVVADTGVGIAEEDQHAVFEKFRQGTAVTAGDAMTREYSGTGLGLSIVKELCKLLGGEIALKSELGKGSEFTVRIPWRYREPRHGASLGDSIDGLALGDAIRAEQAAHSVAPGPSLGIGDP
ncbi:MAG: HAMP domain-containing histidine kinase [Planctomycetaceae bacterium]|nr:HAMP domain-containing histidine kinase [Planctomycetaceae bacterium]